MKPKNTLRQFLALAGSSLIAISSAAADLFWSANGISQGGAGTWDTSNARWGSVAAGPYGTTWDNTTNASDTAVFGSTAGAIALGTNITVGGLTFNTTGYSITAGNTLTLSGTSTPIINVATTATQSVTIASKISGDDGLQKSGAGILILSGANDFTGGLTLAGGTVQLGVVADTLGAANSSITVTASSTLNFGGGGTHTIAKSLLVNGTTTFTTVKSASGTSTITGIVSGSGTIKVNDAGSVDQRPLIFSNASNTFTGTVDLTNNRSTLRVASIGDATGAGNILLGRTSDNGFYLDSTAVASVALNHRRIEIASGGTAGGSVNIYNNNTTASNTLSINTALLVNSTGGTKDIRLGGVNTGANTFAGKIDDANGTVITIRKQGVGNWAIGNASNTFTGAITLDSTTTSAGTLAYTSAGGANPITFNQTTGTATLSYTGSADQTMSGPITANALTSGTITLDSSSLGAVNYSNPASLGSAASGIRKLVLSGSSTGSNILAGQWADNTGTAATLTKNGAGKWVLTGSNTYTGETKVNEGTLLINGSTSSTSLVTVNSGATLGGNGTIGGETTVNGFLKPGNSTGLLTVGSLNLNTGASTTFEINGTNRGAVTNGYDALGVNTGGSIDLEGALIFEFGNLAAFANNTEFDLFSFTTTSTGDFDSVTSTGFYAGIWSKSGDIWSLTDEGQTLNFSEVTGNLAAIPEPPAALLGGLGLLALLRRRRN